MQSILHTIDVLPSNGIQSWEKVLQVVQYLACSHVWGQLCEWLAPAPTHSKQKCVAQGLAQDAADTAHMLNGIHEEHKFHFGGFALIVVIHVFLNHIHQLHNI